MRKAKNHRRAKDKGEKSKERERTECETRAFEMGASVIKRDRKVVQ